MIDGHAELEAYYATGQKKLAANGGVRISTASTGTIDRPKQILKRLRMQTPADNVNRPKLHSIKREAQNKVSYPYKDRFCGIYEEKKRTGQLKREDSW